jgi:hypothetical protein
MSSVDTQTPPESIGVQPVLVEGTRIQITSGEGKGRMGYVLSIEFASPEDFTRFHTPNHPQRNTAKVAKYIIRTRDGRTDTFSVAPDELRELDETNGWGRGTI